MTFATVLMRDVQLLPSSYRWGNLAHLISKRGAKTQSQWRLTSVWSIFIQKVSHWSQCSGSPTLGRCPQTSVRETILKGQLKPTAERDSKTFRKKKKGIDQSGQDSSPESIHTVFVRNLSAASRFGMRWVKMRRIGQYLGTQSGCPMYRSQRAGGAPSHDCCHSRRTLLRMKVPPTCDNLPSQMWLAHGVAHILPLSKETLKPWASTCHIRDSLLSTDAFPLLRLILIEKPYQDYTFQQSCKFPGKAARSKILGTSGKS